MPVLNTNINNINLILSMGSPTGRISNCVKILRCPKGEDLCELDYPCVFGGTYTAEHITLRDWLLKQDCSIKKHMGKQLIMKVYFV
jgi:hypothetical protein